MIMTRRLSMQGEKKLNNKFLKDILEGKKDVLYFFTIIGKVSMIHEGIFIPKFFVKVFKRIF